MTSLYRLMFLTIAILLTGCASHSTEKPPVTKVFKGSNQKPDPILQQAMELDKAGIIKVQMVTRSLPPQIKATGPEKILSCLSQPNGRWIQQYNECELSEQNSCESTGGQFNGCASACRHMEGEVMCIQACVPVCSYSADNK
ncbi:hypothetical protein EOPP23_07630 [Endozoicomonas sp. OPT23]|uniref:hypothetical protein n=1 Tax=Endozoicomonas sp. OPT23 TaxID=2072845 RepID=UPI00129A8351|nr:hypothetical protein [Endozoicomonas sp. OPT23]MRI32854.1 hypothetical protein [Endozoicomonas sp. OPT23]